MKSRKYSKNTPNKGFLFDINTFYEDWDHDGVMNGIDCFPMDKKRQDSMINVTYKPVGAASAPRANVIPPTPIQFIKDAGASAGMIVSSGIAGVSSGIAGVSTGIAGVSTGVGKAANYYAVNANKWLTGSGTNFSKNSTSQNLQNINTYNKMTGASAIRPISQSSSMPKSITPKPVIGSVPKVYRPSPLPLKPLYTGTKQITNRQPISLPSKQIITRSTGGGSYLNDMSGSVNRSLYSVGQRAPGATNYIGAIQQNTINGRKLVPVSQRDAFRGSHVDVQNVYTPKVAYTPSAPIQQKMQAFKPRMPKEYNQQIAKNPNLYKQPTVVPKSWSERAPPLNPGVSPNYRDAVIKQSDLKDKRDIVDMGAGYAANPYYKNVNSIPAKVIVERQLLNQPTGNVWGGKAPALSPGYKPEPNSPTIPREAIADPNLRFGRGKQIVNPYYQDPRGYQVPSNNR